MTFNMWALATKNGFDFVNASVPITREEIKFISRAERQTFVQANYMVIAPASNVQILFNLSPAEAVLGGNFHDLHETGTVLCF